jgi:hypothetical protein
MLVLAVLAGACGATRATTNHWTAIGPTGASVVALAFSGSTI